MGFWNWFRPDFDRMYENQDIEGLTKLLGHKNMRMFQNQDVEGLMEMLARKNTFHGHRTLISALKLLGNPTIEYSIKCLISMPSTEKQQSIYTGAMQILSEIGVLAVRPLLKTLALDKSLPFGEKRPIVKATAQIIERMGLQTTDYLIQLMKNDDDFGVRAQAAFFLGYSENQDPVHPLTEALNSPDWLLRTHAALSLCKLSASHGMAVVDDKIEALAKFLSDPLDLVRLTTARVVAQAGDIRGQECLIELIDPTKFGFISLQAIGILGRLGDITAALALIQAMCRIHSSGRYEYFDYNLTAMDALVAMDERGVSVREDLFRLMNDENRFIRDLAACALGRMGDHRVLDYLTTLSTQFEIGLQYGPMLSMGDINKYDQTHYYSDLRRLHHVVMIAVHKITWDLVECFVKDTLNYLYGRDDDPSDREKVKRAHEEIGKLNPETFRQFLKEIKTKTPVDINAIYERFSKLSAG